MSLIQQLLADPSLRQVSTYVQLFILAGFAWFLLRSRAISALRQSLKEQGRRIERLGKEVARLSGLVERFGCVKLECPERRPVSPVAIDTLPDLKIGGTDTE